MEAFLTDENDTYAILQLRYSDETAHERYVMLESLYSMNRCSVSIIKYRIQLD